MSSRNLSCTPLWSIFRQSPPDFTAVHPIRLRNLGGLRLDRERALHAMLDVSTKIQEKALKAALGIVRSDRDIAKSVSETLREHDGIMRLAEAVVQNAKESRLSRAADFLADENVRGFAEEICRYTKEAASQASAVHSTAKKVLETAKKVSDETYLATTQVRAHPELYGDTVEETAKEVDSVWNRNESAMARLIDGARSLARLDHDIPLLSGFLDVHKELFPEMPKLRYEDISNEAKEKIGDRRKHSRANQQKHDKIGYFDPHTEEGIKK